MKWRYHHLRKHPYSCRVLVFLWLQETEVAMMPWTVDVMKCVFYRYITYLPSRGCPGRSTTRQMLKPPLDRYFDLNRIQYSVFMSFVFNLLGIILRRLAWGVLRTAKKTGKKNSCCRLSWLFRGYVWHTNFPSTVFNGDSQLPPLKVLTPCTFRNLRT